MLRLHKINICKSILAISLSIFLWGYTNGQKVSQFNSWWYYSGSYRLKEHWTINLLYSWSRHDFVKDWQISKLGLSTNHYLSRNFGVGASYEWAIIFPYGELPVPEKRKEHRFLQRIFFKDKIQKVSLGSMIELEQFFRNSDFLQRARVKLSIKFPILFDKNGNQKLGMSFSEQVFILINNDSAPKLGQNRYYGGFDIAIAEKFTLALGYLNQYIIIRPETIENDHTLMVGIFHRTDFRKK